MPIVAASISPLWSATDTEQKEILTVGKVQNLRIAARALHGVEVPANTPFSVWAQIGRPHAGKGYVPGREIREGCLVPTIAGGLCQLSNALYDAACHAGFTVIERHRHSQIIPGSFAEHDRDATIKWNYLDLRFQSTHAFRIEAELTADDLIVRLKSTPQSRATPEQRRSVARTPAVLNDCYSCGNRICAKHPRANVARRAAGVTTYIPEGDWPEHSAYIRDAVANDDVVIPRPQRSLQQRIRSALGANIFASKIRQDEAAAFVVARRIPWNSTHLVVSQNLLPFLWDMGVLGGRTFDVMMTRLPFETLHARLDSAYARYPESKTLRDFRVPQAFIDLENTALTRARSIITPHAEIAAIFANKSVVVPWRVPESERLNVAHGDKILFPATTLGRKGAYEMRRLARELSLSLVTIGPSYEDPAFWNNIPTTRAEQDPLTAIGLVVYPTYVEHQPRTILRALATGRHVITTPACGLAPTENLTIVPVGDYDALRGAVETALTRRTAAPLIETGR